MARHRSRSSRSSAFGLVAGASYRLPISGQAPQKRTARTDAVSVSTDPARANHHQPVTWAVVAPLPSTTVAAGAESSAVERPTTTVTTSPTATTAPRAATPRRTRRRVTSKTPQHPTATRPKAPARGTWPPEWSTSAEPARVSGAAQGLPPDRAAGPEPTRPSRTVGPNRRRWSAMPRLGPGGVRRPDQVGVEAGARAGVAGRTLLVDLEEHGVTVAVETHRDDVLAMAGGLALDPVLPAAAAPVRRAPGRQRGCEGFVVHPPEHQHLARVVLLGDRRHQPGVVAAQALGDGGVQIHGAILPSSRSPEPPGPERHRRHRSPVSGLDVWVKFRHFHHKPPVCAATVCWKWPHPPRPMATRTALALSRRAPFRHFGAGRPLGRAAGMSGDGCPAEGEVAQPRIVETETAVRTATHHVAVVVVLPVVVPPALA